MASNGALSARNERVKYAKSIGVEKPHTLKAGPLEDAITKAEELRDYCECGILKGKCDKCNADPFDPIDPTTEGDHLEEDAINTVGEAIATRDATREAWLMDAGAEIEELYRQVGFSEVDTNPYVISVGFPQGNVRKIIGQCHHAENQGGTAHIFINPTQDDGLRVLEIIAHEFAHRPGYKGHTGDFRKMASSLLVGCGGKNGTGFTSTNINEDSKPLFEAILAKLGPYPHTAINLSLGGVKKQTTRMLKAVCPGPMDEDTEEREACPLTDESGKGFVVRLTKKWAEVGMPSCPCGTEMILDEKDGE